METNDNHQNEMINSENTEAHNDTENAAAEKIGNGVTTVIKKATALYKRVKDFILAQSKKTLMTAGAIILGVIIAAGGIYQLSLNSARRDAEKLYYIQENPSAAYRKIKGYAFSFISNSKFQSEKKLYLLSTGKSTTPSTTKTTKTTKPIVMVQGLQLDKSSNSYTKANGTVYNAGSSKVTFVKIKVSFKDSRGQVIDTAWTYAVGSEGLNPGESKKFSCSVTKDTKITSVSYEILD